MLLASAHALLIAHKVTISFSVVSLCISKFQNYEANQLLVKFQVSTLE